MGQGDGAARQCGVLAALRKERGDREGGTSGEKGVLFNFSIKSCYRRRAGNLRRENPCPPPDPMLLPLSELMTLCPYPSCGPYSSPAL